MQKKAFTLFELIIVVALIGIIYALVLTNFNTKKEVKILKLSNLKESLQPFWQKGKRVDLYLYDHCEKSALFINDTYQEELKATINLSEFHKTKVYKTDYNGEVQEIEFTPIMIENKLKKVCLQYTVFPNGSGSSYIIKRDKDYFIFYPYFQDVNQTDDLSTATSLLRHKTYRGVDLDAIHD